MPPQSIQEFRRAFEANDLTRDQVGHLIDVVADLSRQVDWFKRQMFGEKSERRLVDHDPMQPSLGQDFDSIPTDSPAKKTTVGAHERERKPKVPGADSEESAQFFDATKVPVEVIEVANPDIEGLSPQDYEIIGEKVSHRLAQRPGAYVVLKYVRKVYKLRESKRLSAAPAPLGVIEGSRADVSFVAGLMIDKLMYHLPLHRQHLRLQAAGFKISRQWLTQLMQSGVELLEPVFDAHCRSVIESRVLAMDETPIKAGVESPGKMKQAYFWPVYGERDEITFFYFPDRSHGNVVKALGMKPPDGAVLVSDGYGAYEAYAKKVGLTHAQCWAHARREVFEARDVEPAAADYALERIAEFYEVEEEIRKRNLTGHAKLRERMVRTKPLVDAFLRWVDDRFENHGLLPSNPFLKALAYIRERREELKVFLRDADVPIDTNHLERALRVVPMGRKSWMFCWTELGARHVAMMQSLLTTCRLQGIDGYEYLVDVLQRISQHPASRVDELTPRRWKELFATNPLRSDLHRDTTPHKSAA